MKDKIMFYIFGGLQAVTFGLITFFLLQTTDIGSDTAVLLSALFPVFTLAVEYMIYCKK